MDNKPKTKEVIRTVKEHTAGEVKDKVAQVGFKTKETVKDKTEEQFVPSQNRKQEQSAESHASDKVTETAEHAADDVKYTAGKVVTSTAKQIKKKYVQKKSEVSYANEPEETAETELTEVNTPGEEISSPENPPKEKQDALPEAKKDIKEKAETETADQAKNTKETAADSKKPQQKTDAEKGKGSVNPAEKSVVTSSNNTESVKKDDAIQETKKNIIRKKPNDKADIKELQLSLPKEQQVESTAPEREIRPRTREKNVPKQRGQMNVKSVGIKPGEYRKPASQAQNVKRIERNTSKTIKAADKSFKKAEKKAKATKKAAERTAKAAKRSEEAARRTVKVAVKAVKAAIKATVEGIKAAVAAAKELIAVAAAGSPAAIVIIIVICLIAAVGGSCFGIFLANDETTGTEMTVTQAISTLSGDFYNRVFNMEGRSDADEVKIVGDVTINWKNVLSVYAVKYTNSDDGFEVATIDGNKLEKMKKVLDDMYAVSGIMVPKVTTTKDANGNNVTTTTKEFIITIVGVSAKSQAAVYRFTDDENKQLEELLSDDYAPLWDELISSGGTIINGDTSHISVGQFAWPLSIDGNISSNYGYRTDPINGVRKLHGGTDIAAPAGTPILAAADGVVTTAGYNNGGYGYYVIIKHDDVYQTLYGHCSVLHVTAGQAVKQGQLIAEVGSTGHSTGNHLHFEVRINGNRVDAMQFYK